MEDRTAEDEAAYLQPFFSQQHLCLLQLSLDSTDSNIPPSYFRIAQHPDEKEYFQFFISILKTLKEHLAAKHGSIKIKAAEDLGQLGTGGQARVLLPLPSRSRLRTRKFEL